MCQKPKKCVFCLTNRIYYDILHTKAMTERVVALPLLQRAVGRCKAAKAGDEIHSRAVHRKLMP